MRWLKTTRSTRWWLCATGLVAAVWLTSLLFTITRFGNTVTVTLQEGFLGVYWGGDPQWRNAWVDNGFIVPRNTCGAGRSFPEGMKWAFYGPRRSLLQPDTWPDEIRRGTFFNFTLGLWRPNFGCQKVWRFIILPTWLPLLICTCTLLFLSWRNRKRRLEGGCQTCRYNLTGNVSGQCPECGTPIQFDLI